MAAAAHRRRAAVGQLRQQRQDPATQPLVAFGQVTPPASAARRPGWPEASRSGSPDPRAAPPPGSPRAGRTRARPGRPQPQPGSSGCAYAAVTGQGARQPLGQPAQADQGPDQGHLEQVQPTSRLVAHLRLDRDHPGMGHRQVTARQDLVDQELGVISSPPPSPASMPIGQPTGPTGPPPEGPAGVATQDGHQGQPLRSVPRLEVEEPTGDQRLCPRAPAGLGRQQASEAGASGPAERGPSALAPSIGQE